ncbi:MAG: hypothetical protein M1833_006242 [Piccolia ochrophora]|nr:MAG: hypothetical protein M1833_006242 [Piccolia ochrophora]
MKLFNLLPLAAFSSAIVIPNEAMLNDLAVQSERVPSSFDGFPSRGEVRMQVEDALTTAIKNSKSAFDKAIDSAINAGNKASNSFKCFESMTGFDAQAWLRSAEDGDAFRMLEAGHPPPPPDHGPPSHGPPPPPHHPDGHHGHHDHKPNKTVYELIAESKYTTKLAKLINDDEELVTLLNGTKANYTVFAPTDRAFEKIPKHGKEPSKELIRKVLLYHISGDFYPAGRVLASHTIPSLLKEEQLGDEAQRLRVGLTGKGLTVNFESRIIAINIFGTNGVIHGVDSIILPPIETLKIIDLLPEEFSTLQVGLYKTGLWEDFSKTTAHGGTFFAPSNFAFRLLGPKANAFLFSKYGLKYLKAVLKYHVVTEQTLYSDAFYKNEEAGAENIPKGIYHVDLPTLLGGRSLGVDIARYGGFISIKVNGFSRVTVQDGIAKDGVIQVVGNVLIPPKKLGEQASIGEELTVDELKERLGPYVEREGLEL